MADQKTITIVCKAKRIGGTKTGKLFGKDYHFKPTNPADPESEHVCAIPVEDAQAIYRLLAIKDHYALLDPSDELPPRPAPEKGQTIAGAPVVPQADKPIIIKSGDGQEVNLTDMTMEDLAIFAKENFSITPHHKWKKETLIAKIVEATRGED